MRYISYGFESLWVKIFSCLNDSRIVRISKLRQIFDQNLFFLPSCNCSRFIYARIFFEITRVVCSISSRMIRNNFQNNETDIICIYLYTPICVYAMKFRDQLSRLLSTRYTYCVHSYWKCKCEKTSIFECGRNSERLDNADISLSPR